MSTPSQLQEAPLSPPLYRMPARGIPMHASLANPLVYLPIRVPRASHMLQEIEAPDVWSIEDDQRGFMDGSTLTPGQAVHLLVRFSGVLAEYHPEVLQRKCTQSYWEEVMQQFFTESAMIKLHLWKNSEREECKSFGITTPVIPRFFLVLSQCGVTSTELCFFGAREANTSPTRVEVVCARAAWTFRFSSGYLVTLRGNFEAEIVMSPTTIDPAEVSAALSRRPKISAIHFTSLHFDKYIAMDAIGSSRVARVMLRPVQAPRVSGAQTGNESGPASTEEPKAWMCYENATVPDEPVNAFGIPQMAMRCLELAENVELMDDLFAYSMKHNLGPLDSLHLYTHDLFPRGYFSGMSVNQPPLNLGGMSPVPETPQSAATLDTPDTRSAATTPTLVSSPESASPESGEALSLGSQHTADQRLETGY